MPRNLNIDKWIQIAKFTQAAGEMAPFPYIKGAAGCVVMILEAIEKAGKNDKDLRALADDIGTTMEIVKESIEAHGISSATHFKAVCGDFQTYLENLLSNLDTTQHNLDGKRFKHFLKALKARKIADTINDYKQQMNNIKSDYLVRGITDVQLEVPVMQDVLSTRITEAAEMSQLRVTSTVESRSDHIIGEIHNLGEIQREHTTQICSKLQDRKGYYKGMVRDLAPGDIYLRETEPHDRRYGYCTVECSNTVKLIRTYQPHIGNEEDRMKQLDYDIDIFLKPRHPNIAQVFGVCRSPNLPAIIFHGSMRVPIDKYLDNIPVQDLIPVYINLLRDMPSATGHLADYYHDPEDHRNVHGTIYVNEHGRLLFVDILSIYIMKITLDDSGLNPFNTYWNQSLAQPVVWRRTHAIVVDVELSGVSLNWVYHSIFFCHVGSCRVQKLSQRGQHFVPGSILTVHGQTLVGGVQDKSQLSQWDVCWRGPCFSSGIHRMLTFSLPSTDCGSIVIDPLVHPPWECEGNTIPILCAGTVLHSLVIYLHSSTELSRSWIAQASHLDTSLRSRRCIDKDGLYQISEHPYF
ncbi:hypothetical protein IW262DRAFT_1413461 [Armillaria fumosa]|nr:hypothetical protein IW262DRAFT_1413461 [Armillaria fumosa]